MFYEDLDLNYTNEIDLDTPELLFGRNNKHTNPQNGLQTYGPWDRNKKGFNQIYFEVIFEARINENKVEEVMKYIKANNNRWGSFEDVFRTDIRIANKSLWKQVSNNNDIIKALNLIKNRNKPFGENKVTICIFVGRDHKDDLTTPMYDHFKLIFTKEGYLTQFISLKEGEYFDNMDDYNKKLFARNIQLQTYAKAGGIPWMIDSINYNVDAYMGIRFAKLKDDIHHTTPYAVGTLSIFDDLGIWKRIISSDPFDYYSKRRTSSGLYVPPEVVESLIKETFISISSDVSDPNIIIHKNNYFSREEYNAIFETAADIGINVALVQFVESDYIFFNKSNRFYLPPNKGYAVQIRENEALLINTDPSHNTSIGTPRVLKIVLHSYSTYKPSMKNLLQQIRDLTYISWRNLYRTDYLFPTTLSYAYKAAKLYAQDVNVNSNLLDKLWFL